MRRIRSLRRASMSLAAAGIVGCLLSLAACTSTPMGAAPADADTIAERASTAGIAPELVYPTEVNGYDLASQSVGPAEADCLSATWSTRAPAR